MGSNPITSTIKGEHMAQRQKSEAIKILQFLNARQWSRQREYAEFVITDPEYQSICATSAQIEAADLRKIEKRRDKLHREACMAMKPSVDEVRARLGLS